jgi:hypothetical protein
MLIESLHAHTHVRLSGESKDHRSHYPRGRDGMKKDHTEIIQS